jgi:hypothetical protein
MKPISPRLARLHTSMSGVPSGGRLGQDGGHLGPSPLLGRQPMVRGATGRAGLAGHLVGPGAAVLFSDEQLTRRWGVAAALAATLARVALSHPGHARAGVGGRAHR